MNSNAWLMAAVAARPTRRLRRPHPVPLRSPLSRKPLGARMRAWTGYSVLFVLGVSATPFQKADIGPTGAEPTFEQRFSESKIVALARIEAGALGSYSSQIYRARVTASFKGAEKDRILHFWGGNVGSTAYGVGEVYLLMLRNAWKPVGDVSASFGSPNEPLYEAVSLNCPVLVWRSTASPPPGFPTDQSVFLFACPEAPLALRPRSAGVSVIFHSWIAHDELVDYLKRLAASREAKSHGGA
jgi:hypothetical protein